MKPRVAIVGPVFPYRAGIAYCTTRLAEEIGAEVISFSRQFPKMFYPGGDDIDPTLPRAKGDFIVDVINPLTWLRAGARLRKYDAVIFVWWIWVWALPYRVMMAMLPKRTRVVLQCHNIGDKEPAAWKRALTNMVLRRGDVLVVHAASEGEDAARRLGLSVPGGADGVAQTILSVPVHPEGVAQTILSVPVHPEGVAQTILSVPVHPDGSDEAGLEEHASLPEITGTSVPGSGTDRIVCATQDRIGGPSFRPSRERIVQTFLPVHELGGAIPSREDARAALHLDGHVALFFGHVRPFKGLDIALRAWPMLRTRVTLVVAGEAWWKSEEEYRALAAGRDDVRFDFRFIPDAEIATYFAAADVVLAPYRIEAQSGVALTAFHFARPVIATRVGGLPEIIEEGRNGMLVPPEDPPALAAAIDSFFARTDHDAMNQHAAASARKYSWSEYGALMNRLVAGE